MRRVTASLICALMITLAAGCSGGEAEKYTADIYSFYKNMISYGATLEVTMNHGDYVTNYTLEHAYTPESGHVITVVEPLSLAGLVTKISSGSTEIIYAGSLFAPQSLEGTGVTPIKLLPNMLEAWAGGVPGSSYFESIDGTEYVVQSFYANVDGDEFMYRTWFDTDSLQPKRNETFYGGKCVMTLEFTAIEISSGAH
jgi:outer membrane lipoprotein-sorting protein